MCRRCGGIPAINDPDRFKFEPTGKFTLHRSRVHSSSYSRQKIKITLMSLKHTAKRVGSSHPLLRRAIQVGGRLLARSPKFQDLYSNEVPCEQTAFDIFSGEWSSAVPGFQTGTNPLFNDTRIHWLREQLGSLGGKRILELGPLEGGQSWMMEQAGAQVTAIEANERAFLKCLIVKNALNMKAKFLHGDFRPYLASAEESFDLVTAI